MSVPRAIIIASICLSLTAAVAQQREAATTTCNSSNQAPSIVRPTLRQQRVPPWTEA
jgi:hypothetical protein